MSASAELTRLMHAVLDGEATPYEAEELRRRMAADPAVREEFEAWGALFGALDGLPRAHPPEGLVAAIDAAASTARVSAPHLRVPARLLATPWRRRPPQPTKEAFAMSETSTEGRATRKLWIGGGLAVIAVAVSVVAFNYPPQAASVLGTIMPAERYRAPQSGAEAIKLGDQTIAQLMQTDAFDRAVKDPQLKALAQDANVQLLAKLLASNPQANLVMLQHAEAAQAAVQNSALAQMLMADVQLSNQVLSQLMAQQSAAQSVAQQSAAQAVAQSVAQQSAAQNAVLANAIMQNTQAAQAILANVQAAQLALAHPQAAQAILANAEAARVLMLTPQANAAMLNSASAQSMAQNAAANLMLLKSAQAELVAR